VNCIFIASLQGRISFAIAAFGNIVAHNIPAAKETVQLGSCKREGSGNFFLHLISLGISGAEKVGGQDGGSGCRGGLVLQWVCQLSSSPSYFVLPLVVLCAFAAKEIAP